MAGESVTTETAVRVAVQPKGRGVTALRHPSGLHRLEEGTSSARKGPRQLERRAATGAARSSGGSGSPCRRDRPAASPGSSGGFNPPGSSAWACSFTAPWSAHCSRLLGVHVARLAHSCRAGDAEGAPPAGSMA